MKLTAVSVLACLLGSTVAFAPVHPTTTVQKTALEAKISPLDEARKLGAVFLAASTILSNVAIVPQEVYAFDAGGSSQVIAARSGGRAGGRAPSRAASPSRSSYKASPKSTRVIERQTTIIQQPGGSAMMMAPQPMYAQPMYGGGGGGSGLGLVLGLNAVSGIADGFREARQENEIRSTRQELTEARIKEAEMEARLRQLEMNR